MAGEGVGGVSRLEATTGNVDVDLKNVSLSSSSCIFGGMPHGFVEHGWKTSAEKGGKAQHESEEPEAPSRVEVLEQASAVPQFS